MELADAFDSPATVDDAPLLATLIHELAEFERLSHEASVTGEDIARDGFGAARNFAPSLPSGMAKPLDTPCSLSFFHFPRTRRIVS